MKKIININFQGQVIAIEEKAYETLRNYIDSLKHYFSREEDGNEIVNDIENRIAELFGNRLKLGINCITDEDVESIIASIGKPDEFDAEINEFVGAEDNSSKEENTKTNSSEEPKETPRQLFRNSNDMILAGVCSGLANYLKIDPALVRIVFILLFSVLFWVYIILWIVLKKRPLQSTISKRLYRNPNERIVAGVCGGIASYFKIETWIPRVLFIVPLFFNLLGLIHIPVFPWDRFSDNFEVHWNLNFGVVIVYLVLWIVIPKANSIKQKLEMMGEEAYLKSIRESVNESVANVKSRPDNEMPPTPPAYSSSIQHANNEKTAADDSTAENELPTPHQPIKQPTQQSSIQHNATSQSERSGCAAALVIFLKIVFFVIIGISTIGLLSMLGVSLFAGVSMLPLKSLFIDAGMENTLFWVSLALLIAVPILSITVWIIRRLKKRRSRPAIGVVATIFWIAGALLAGVLASKITKKFNVETSTDNTITLTPFKGNKLYIEMLDYHDDFYTYKTGFGPGAEIDDLPYYTINKDSLLFSNISLKILESNDSAYHVTTIACIHGRNLKLAKAKTHEFTYAIQQNDSVLHLPEFFATPIRQGFRDQQFIIKVEVPAGKRVEIDNALKEFQHNRIPRSIRKKHKIYLRNNESSGKENRSEEFIMENGKLTSMKMDTDSI